MAKCPSALADPEGGVAGVATPPLIFKRQGSPLRFERNDYDILLPLRQLQASNLGSLRARPVGLDF